MANLQRVVISLLVVLTATFLFFAQATEATKGPKITNKVGLVHLLMLKAAKKRCGIGLLRHHARRWVVRTDCNRPLWQNRARHCRELPCSRHGRERIWLWRLHLPPCHQAIHDPGRWLYQWWWYVTIGSTIHRCVSECLLIRYWWEVHLRNQIPWREFQIEA